MQRTKRKRDDVETAASQVHADVDGGAQAQENGAIDREPPTKKARTDVDNRTLLTPELPEAPPTAGSSQVDITRSRNHRRSRSDDDDDTPLGRRRQAWENVMEVCLPMLPMQSRMRSRTRVSQTDQVKARR